MQGASVCVGVDDEREGRCDYYYFIILFFTYTYQGSDRLWSSETERPPKQTMQNREIISVEKTGEREGCSREQTTTLNLVIYGNKI